MSLPESFSRTNKSTAPTKQRFRIVYGNGFEVIEAKDIFEAACFLKKNYGTSFRMPVAIEAEAR